MLSTASLSLFEKPAPVAGLRVRRPRPYQAESIAAIHRELAVHRSTMLVLATGLGKSFTAGEIARQATGRVLALAHTTPLVHQLKADLEETTGELWQLEQADNWAHRNGTANVVASIQSIGQKDRLAKWPRDAFSLIIADECHHYYGRNDGLFRRPIDHFASAKVLGLTATPDRTDKKSAQRIFELATTAPGGPFAWAYKMDLLDGINEGWLVDVDQKPPRACAVDLNAMPVNGESGDFQAGAMDEAMAKELAPVIEACLIDSGTMRTLVFLPGVESVYACAEALNLRRPGCARGIDGKNPDKRKIIDAFKRGEFQFLVNCAILTEGFDCREVQCIVHAAATKSRSRCTQIVGRGTRPMALVDACADADGRKAAIAASAKPKLIWIDLKYNYDRHDLACPLSIIGGSFTDKERNLAERNLNARGGNVQDELKKARKEIADRAARAAVRLQLGSNMVSKRRPKKVRPPKPLPSDPPTVAQCTRFAEFGLPVELATSYEAAQTLLRKEFFAKSRSWCDYRQREFLRARCGGINGWAMTKTEGKRIAEAWKANGWRRP